MLPPSVSAGLRRRARVILLLPVCVIVLATLVDNGISVWHSADARLRGAQRYVADYCTGMVDAADVDVNRVTMCENQRHVIDTSGVLFRVSDTFKHTLLDVTRLTVTQSPRLVLLLTLLLVVSVLCVRALAALAGSVTPPLASVNIKKYS